ncbi:MAG: hypothetical protein FJ161_03335, partial [Gammaproteobacteria bacterium]|nr:hypothetical protein [Gammaproteobacteria bacterium]
MSEYAHHSQLDETDKTNQAWNELATKFQQEFNRLIECTAVIESDASDLTTSKSIYQETQELFTKLSSRPPTQHFTADNPLGLKKEMEAFSYYYHQWYNRVYRADQHISLLDPTEI